MAKKVRINGDDVTPINKVKLWTLAGWTPAKIRKVIEQKQAEVKARRAGEASK